MPVQSTQGQMLSYGSVFVLVEVARLTLRVHALDGDWAELFHKVVMLCAGLIEIGENGQVQICTKAPSFDISNFTFVH